MKGRHLLVAPSLHILLSLQKRAAILIGIWPFIHTLKTFAIQSSGMTNQPQKNLLLLG